MAEPMTPDAQDREAQERVQRVADAITEAGPHAGASTFARAAIAALDIPTLVAEAEKRGRVAALREAAAAAEAQSLRLPPIGRLSLRGTAAWITLHAVRIERGETP